MTRFLAALAGAAATVALAAPAAAQSGYGNTYARGAVGFDSRIAQLESRIDAGIRSGAIDRNEAWRLRNDAAELRRLHDSYARNGLSSAEQTELRQRLRLIRTQVRTADRGSWDRYERGDDWADYDRDDGYNQGYGQGYGNQGYAYGRDTMTVGQRLVRLDARLQAGVQNRQIDRREAANLRRQISDLSQLERSYSRGGLTAREDQELRERLRTLRQNIRVADRGTWDRYEQRGEWAAYDDVYQRDAYGRPVYGGRGGPDELEACETNRGGIGAVIGGLFGVDQCPGLDVGARASGNLYAVPYEYRDQFRDGPNIYYRSDGRAIYGIDTRSNTVLRVYPMNR